MRRLLPPHLFLCCLGLMLLCHKFWPILGWEHYLYRWFGLCFVVIGLGVTVSSARLFRKRATNIQTFGRPDLLVTEGLFRYTRNPMYLGFSMALFGSAWILGSASCLLVVLLFVGLAQFWYIPYEEKAMLETFGQAYRKYQAQTGRWL